MGRAVVAPVVTLALVLGSCGDDGGDEPRYSYPAREVEAFLVNCEGSGGSPEYCNCAIDKFQAEVPYQDIVEDFRGAAGVPPEHRDVVDECLAE